MKMASSVLRLRIPVSYSVQSISFSASHKLGIRMRCMNKLYYLPYKQDFYCENVQICIYFILFNNAEICIYFIFFEPFSALG